MALNYSKKLAQNFFDSDKSIKEANTIKKSLMQKHLFGKYTIAWNFFRTVKAIG